GSLRLDVDCAEALAVGLHDEAQDLAGLLVLGPHDRHVGARARGDPALDPSDHVLVAHLAAARAHRAGVRAGVGLGEPETADGLARGQTRQPLVLQGVARPAVDGVHDQARLDADERPHTRVHVLDLATDQPVRAVAGLGPAVALRPRHAQSPDLAEAPGQALGEHALEPPITDVLEQLGAHVVAHRVADHALLGGVKRVYVVEVLEGRRGRASPCRHRGHLRLPGRAPTWIRRPRTAS